MSSRRKDRHPIPLIYRLTFHYFEPLVACGGVIQALFTPIPLTEISMPGLASHMSLPTAPSYSVLQTLYTQMAGGWMVLVFNDFVTLRAFDRDVRVWRYVLSAHMFTDITYCLAMAQDWDKEFWHPWSWTFNMWLSVFFLTIAPMVVKISFLLGLGVDFGVAGRQKASMKSG